MSVRRTTAWLLTFIGIVAGTVSDRATPQAPLVLGGYRVLAADFHMHSSTWSDGALTPWGLVLEAERQGLDVIAMTGHNQILDGTVARWFSGLVRGPVVILGEEILTVGHHVIAVGTNQVVDFRLPVSQQLDEIHRQGGVAIAAHPTRDYAAGFEGALDRLDGAEICHPLIYALADGQEQLEAFAAKAPLTAIGSSDFHGFARLGLCRTYVFATDDTAAAVLAALKAHRTVVYGRGGRAYGDPDLIQLAATHPTLRDVATTDRPSAPLEWMSRIFGVAGLIGLVLPKRF